MTRLSVNINKIALIRNARGGNLPDLVQIAQDIEAFGAEGITVHPRPDERHIRFDDLPKLKQVVKTEFNIEGNPTREFMDLVLENLPHQVTLVPDPPGVLTSDTGWDVIRHRDFLKEVVGEFKKAGIRVSLFCNAEAEMVEAAAATGADRIEFYTGSFAKKFAAGEAKKAVEPFTRCAEIAHSVGLGLNAGHDLNLDNLKFFKENCPHLLEVSIGHALISDALYFGLANTVRMYLRQLK
jgi:pyridoxine 5-phosphate synthase